MAAGLAHELNQPLAAIHTYASCGLHRIILRSLSNDELREDLEKIIAQVDRAGSIIKHIRQFIMDRKPHRSTADLNTVVRKAVSFAREELADRGIRFTDRLDDRLPLLLVDQVQIEQVLLNLIQNAIDAMADAAVADPELTVTTLLRSDGDILVTVADNGPGLTPEMQQQIFQPFSTTKKSGLGLGLVVSQAIIESHGGCLWLTPGLGGGATFAFSLPPPHRSQA